MSISNVQSLFIQGNDEVLFENNNNNKRKQNKTKDSADMFFGLSNKTAARIERIVFELRVVRNCRQPVPH